MKETRTFRTVEEVMEAFVPHNGFGAHRSPEEMQRALSNQIVEALLPPFQKAILESESAKKQPRAKSKKK